MSQKIKAVFFDAGGTLVYPDPSLEGVYCRVCREFGVELRVDSMRTILHRLWASYQESRGESHGVLLDSDERDRAFWRDYSRKIVAEVPGLSSVEFDPWFDAVHAAFASSQTWVLFPEVDDVLSELERRGVTVGIVSNWGSSLLGICDDLGLADRMSFVLASAVVGYKKPSPEIFLRALDLAEVEPAEAVHVGDTHLDDVVGAERVGIRPLYIDRGGGLSPTGESTTDLRVLLEWF